MRNDRFMQSGPHQRLLVNGRFPEGKPANLASVGFTCLMVMVAFAGIITSVI